MFIDGLTEQEIRILRVAPATRSTASNKVKLTQSELNLAKKFNLTPEQFALEKLKLEKQNG